MTQLNNGWCISQEKEEGGRGRGEFIAEVASSYSGLGQFLKPAQNTHIHTHL